MLLASRNTVGYDAKAGGREGFRETEGIQAQAKGWRTCGVLDSGADSGGSSCVNLGKFLTSLGLCAFICKMGPTVPTWQDCCEIKDMHIAKR